MNKLTPEYLAGFFDGEGTFQLQIAFKKGNGRFQITPRIQVGLKRLPEEVQLIRDIQEHLSIGKIYLPTGGIEAGMIRYCTTTLTEVVKLCALLQPNLRLKHEQCRKLSGVAQLMVSKKPLRYVNGYKTSNFDIYSREEMLEIVTIATTMNASQQTNKFRNALGRNTQYYIDRVNQAYDQQGQAIK